MTDYKAQGWTGSCTLQGLKGLVVQSVIAQACSAARSHAAFGLSARARPAFCWHGMVAQHAVFPQNICSPALLVRATIAARQQ